ncbi:unnamed protein product [Alopecurus aequalis]
MALQTTPLRTILQKELYFHLYLKRGSAEPNTDQKTILKSKHPLGFGMLLATDWPIYDGRNPRSNLVARLQGLHAETGKVDEGWHASVTVVFEGQCYKGSTLHLMGTSIGSDEWAIVGGTGEFTLAQGVMYIVDHHDAADASYAELEFRALYTPMKKVPGGNGENSWTLGV